MYTHLYYRYQFQTWWNRDNGAVQGLRVIDRGSEVGSEIGSRLQVSGRSSEVKILADRRGSEGSEVAGQTSWVRIHRSATVGQKTRFGPSGVRGQRPEVRGQRSEVRGQSPEVRGQRNQRSQVRVCGS